MIISLVSLGPLAAVVGAGLAQAPWSAGSIRETPCWILPNAHVLIGPDLGKCPLRPNEAIRRLRHRGGSTLPVSSGSDVRRSFLESRAALEVGVNRDGRVLWFDLPRVVVPLSIYIARWITVGIVLVLLLGAPLFVLWRSEALAALPFLLFYSAVSIVFVTLMLGQHSEPMTRAALVAMVFAPATVTHLAMTFPRERQVIREAPQLLSLPYGLAVVMVPVGWFALDRNPLLWPPFMYLVLSLTAGAWVVLMSSCGFALRESHSAMERARARVVFVGALLVPLVPTLGLAGGTGNAELATAYLWSAAVTMPLPVALAISRYNLFDLGGDVRRLVGRVGYFGIAAGLASCIMIGLFAAAGQLEGVPSWSVLFVTAFACVSVVEMLRGRTLGLLDSMLSPRLEELRRLREAFERELSRAREEEFVTHRLGEVVREGLRPRAACVWLEASGDWVPAFAFGENPPARSSLVEAALGVLDTESLVYLELQPEVDPRAGADLRAAGVEVVSAIDCGEERLGLLLLSGRPNDSPYTGMDLDFLAAAALQAGIALRNAQLTRELLASERQATTGRVALGLAHDLGKDLDWMHRLVNRLPQRLDDRKRLARDVALIQEFSAGVVEGVRRFVHHATQPRSGSAEIEPFTEVVERAVARVERIHGPDRVTQSIDPALKLVDCHANLGRVLANLLDNGLHASPPDEPVRLFATLESEDRQEGWIVAVVEDRGSGIPEELRREVFEPGVSTRLAEGGSGIGLTVVQEIVSDLGGSIELFSPAEGGTRAEVWVRARQGP